MNYQIPANLATWRVVLQCRKCNIYDLDYCQVLYHEPLARVNAQALPLSENEFIFTVFFQGTVV